MGPMVPVSLRLLSTGDEISCEVRTARPNSSSSENYAISVATLRASAAAASAAHLGRRFLPLSLVTLFRDEDDVGEPLSDDETLEFRDLLVIVGVNLRLRQWHVARGVGSEGETEGEILFPFPAKFIAKMNPWTGECSRAHGIKSWAFHFADILCRGPEGGDKLKFRQQFDAATTHWDAEDWRGMVFVSIENCKDVDHHSEEHDLFNNMLNGRAHLQLLLPALLHLFFCGRRDVFPALCDLLHGDTPLPPASFQTVEFQRAMFFLCDSYNPNPCPATTSYKRMRKIFYTDHTEFCCLGQLAVKHFSFYAFFAETDACLVGCAIESLDFPPACVGGEREVIRGRDHTLLQSGRDPPWAGAFQRHQKSLCRDIYHRAKEVLDARRRGEHPRTGRREEHFLHDFENAIGELERKLEVVEETSSETPLQSQIVLPESDGGFTTVDFRARENGA